MRNNHGVTIAIANNRFALSVIWLAMRLVQTPEPRDAGGPARWRWQLPLSALVRSSDFVQRSHQGRPVNTPPKKKLKPRTQSQWGQEYMISFFTFPTTSLETGRESAEEATFSFSVTSFLQ
jgi:hypothetical protein